MTKNFIIWLDFKRNNPLSNFKKTNKNYNYLTGYIIICMLILFMSTNQCTMYILYILSDRQLKIKNKTFNFYIKH